jgi:outer membrane receptor protein involved in Fe transport
MKSKLSYEIAAILAGVTFGAAQAAPATGGSAAGADTLEEIIVTAQRRVESMQNVPIAMQAFSEKALEDLNILTFDDYVKYLPNVSSASNGPSQSEVYMRGLSAGAQQFQGSGGTGYFPNVAVYLDEQSVQLPSRNLDVYAVDLSRIEVLEGPQGTLFGAGAEAGVVRYITNKPILDKTEAKLDAGYSLTAHGEPNVNVSAVLNLPLIADKMALRAVIYSDSRGGYIDNVPATFTRRNTDLGIHYANYPAVGGQCPDGQPPGVITSGIAAGSWCVPPGSPVLNNAIIAGRAINPVTYKGARVELLYKINDDWNVLISQMNQNMDANGVFYQQPNASDGAPLKPLEVTLFNPSYTKDKFSNTAWTVNGKFGALRALYTGGYLSRRIEQVSDYTNYARGLYADYYSCYGPGTGYDNTLTSTCFSPSVTWRTLAERNEHTQHEFRLSTPDDWRIRGIAGAYWEENKVYDATVWAEKDIPTCTSNATPGTAGNGNTGCISSIGTVPGATVSFPGVQPNDAAFFPDELRTTRQTAFFASVDVDIVPKVLTLTLGMRHFRFSNSQVGSLTQGFGCFEQGVSPTGCHNVAYDFAAMGLKDTESGNRSRVNLTWHLRPDAMVYYTYSEGFRPGSFNQNGGAQHAPGLDGQWQFAVPMGYTSDTLKNNELGWKTEWLNHRLQWNGAVYQENWDNVQVSFLQPGLAGNVTFDTNGQNFLIRGIETSFVALLTRGLSVQGSASWNHSKQTNSPALIDTNPASSNFGKPITQVCGTAGDPTTCSDVINPFGPPGAPSANSPPVQFNLRARYEFALNAYHAFVQAGMVHSGHSYTQAGSNPTITSSGFVSTTRLRFENPPFTNIDASLGIAKDAWTAELFAENVANANTSLFTNVDQFIVAETPMRPRIIGVKLGYSF